MLDKLLKIAVVLRVTDELSGPLRQAAGAIEALDKVAERSKGLRDLGENMKSFGKQAMLAGAAAGAAVIGAVKIFSDAQEQATEARLSFMDRTGVDPEWPRLVDLATELGHIYHKNREELEGTAASLSKAGFTTQEILEGALKATVALSVLPIVKGLTGEEVGQLAGVIHNQFMIAAADFPQMVDLLQREGFKSGLEPQDLQMVLRKAGAAAQALDIGGISGFSQILGLVGALKQAGIPARQLSAGLSETFEQIDLIDDKIQKNPELREMLAQHGLVLTFTAHGKFLGIDNLLAQLDKLSVLPNAERMAALSQILGPQSALIFSKLIQLGGVAGLHKAMESLANGATIDQRTSEVLKDLGSQFRGVLEISSELVKAIGGSLAPVLGALLSRVSPIVVALTGFIERHQKLTGIILGSVGVLGVLVFILGAVSFGLGTLIVWMVMARSAMVLFRVATALATGGLGAMVSMIRALGVALFTTPVGWLILGLMILAGLAYVIYRNWGPISAFFTRLWASVRAAFASAVNWIQSLDLFSAGAKLIRTLWEGMKSFASKPIEVIQSIAQKIRDHLPFSPARVGPLRDLGRVRLIETIAESMKAEPMVRAMRLITAQALAASFLALPLAAVDIPARAIGAQQRLNAASAARSSASGGAGLHFTYAPVINLPPGTPKETVARVGNALATDRAQLQRQIAELVAAETERQKRKGFKQ